MAEKAVNDFATTLASAVTSTSATSITVASSAPAGLQSGEFRIRVDNELLLVTSGQNGTTWTVTRGVEGTIAATHSSGADVTHVLTDASFDLLAQQLIDVHVNDSSAAHAASALSFAPTGTVAATDVQGAIAEVAAEAGAGGAQPDASTTVKGITKLSSAPTSATNPIAVGDNDPRMAPIQTGTAAGNLGTAQTIDFQSKPTQQWLVGVLNGNLAVTVNNPVQGSRLKVIALQDATGSRTLTIAGTAVTVPTTANTGLAYVEAVWVDASTFRVASAGVESDPQSILKSTGTTKGDLIAFTGAATPVRQAAGTDGYVLAADSTQTNGVAYKPASQTQTYTKTGTLTTGTGAVRLPIPYAAVLVDVRTMAGTAPTGASLIVDVNKNGTTIFTTQANRPTIAISGNASSAAVPDVTSLAAGDYLTVDIDQVGSTVAGADLTVAVQIRRA